LVTPQSKNQVTTGPRTHEARPGRQPNWGLVSVAAGIAVVLIRNHPDVHPPPWRQKRWCKSTGAQGVPLCTDRRTSSTAGPSPTPASTADAEMQQSATDWAAVFDQAAEVSAQAAALDSARQDW